MADVINLEEETKLRAEVQKWMPDLCTIRRRTQAADIYGGEGSTLTVIATQVPCDLTPQSQALRPTEVVAEQIEARQIYIVSLPVTTDVKFHDLLTVTSQTPNRELLVQSVLTPSSWELERQVVASVEGEPLV